jgi:hypothetical protein
MRTTSMMAAGEILRRSSHEPLTLEAAAAPIDRLLDQLEWLDGGTCAVCHAPGPNGTASPGAPRPGYHIMDCALGRALGSRRMATAREATD